MFGSTFFVHIGYIKSKVYEILVKLGDKLFEIKDWHRTNGHTFQEFLVATELEKGSIAKIARKLIRRVH